MFAHFHTDARSARYRRYGPNHVSFWQLWRHRHAIAQLLVQVAHGSQMDAVEVSTLYGGNAAFGIHLHRLARAVVQPKDGGRYWADTQVADRDWHRLGTHVAQSGDGL
jgi:hypothetical protein